nr:alkaline phosphatase D family protein [Halochromatium glycolicum]
MVLAGPILRRLLPERITLWLATRTPCRIALTLAWEGQDAPQRWTLAPDNTAVCHLPAGEHLHYLLIDLPLDHPLPRDRWIGYELAVQPLAPKDAPWSPWQDWAPDLAYPGQRRPGFRLPSRISALLHGSCRKPHHDEGDGLVQADRLLRERLAISTGRVATGSVMTSSAEPERAKTDRDKADRAATARSAPADRNADDAPPSWPSMLVLTGDQIYADDVAGPMLWAIHQLIVRLGLPVEPLAGETRLADSNRLYAHPNSYYRRERLLPRHAHSESVLKLLFGGVEKPVFTTANAHNHLITLGEVLAMYLLVWSPAVWSGIRLDPPDKLNRRSRRLYASERPQIEAFIADLPAVRRVLAHLPVAMIFDDHDITDDWNLSREWEEMAYGHPFSRRIIGNALIGYLINQGWGNRPEAFDDVLLDSVRRALAQPGQTAHDDCIERLHRFDQWHFQWPTEPPLVVMDSRTHRWRSEISARQPSGLMDWEALTDLQQALFGHPAVLLVSPAPIFGVKLIEAIQRVFTWLGKPLLVDAENWMAHPGAAQVILNIFRHPKTPEHFVVLSGDVHYSFVYDIELRGHERGPDIWQICSSGLRNAFPDRLLAVLDRLNRWLYSPNSPLNWLTRRRRMRVIPRKPEGSAPGRRLLNGSGVGVVELDPDGLPWRIRQLMADGRFLTFTRREAESRWR